MNVDGLISKIKKLLSLANSDNENEAKVAAEKAQELLVKHNLDMQEVENKDFEYTEQLVASEPYIRWHQPFIIDILQEFFFIKVMWYNKFTGFSDRDPGRYPSGVARKLRKDINLLGTKANVQVAHYVFDYLTVVYQRLWLEYKHEHDLGEKSRKSYYEGLTHGLSEKLLMIRNKVQNERGLVLVKDPKLDELLKDTKPHKNNYQPEDDPHARKAGYEHGKNIEIKKPLGEKKSTSNGLELAAPKLALSAPKPYKIWGGYVNYKGDALRVVVRAETKKRALELLKKFQEVPSNYFNNYWSVTQNDKELTAATEEGVWSRPDEQRDANYQRRI